MKLWLSRGRDALMRHKMAIVKNILNLRSAYEALAQRGFGIEGMGLVHGFAGAGKTTAIAWLRNQTNAVHVRALRIWTPPTMLASIMLELGATPVRPAANNVLQIARLLGETNRALYVDEVDYLIGNVRESVMLDTLRDIHDLSKMPVILIGHDGFQRRLAHRPQFARRITQWVEFLPADIDDARVLADTVCEVVVDDELLTLLHKAASGSIGLMVTGLSRLESLAKANGLTSVNVERWGDRPFFLNALQPGEVIKFPSEKRR